MTRIIPRQAALLVFAGVSRSPFLPIDCRKQSANFAGVAQW